MIALQCLCIQALSGQMLLGEASEKAFEQIPRPGMGIAGAIEIRERCAGRNVPSTPMLLWRDLELSDSIIWHENTPETRTDLACNRALLAINFAPMREGFDMPLATPWAVGAVRSSFDALKHRPSEARAADVLALIAMQIRRPRDQDKIVKALAKAVRGGVRTGPTLRGCSEFAYRERDTALVRECATIALAVGLDSTWHELLLARLDSDVGDTAGAARHFFTAVAAARDSISRDEMQWHLQWFVTPNETFEWKRMSPEDGVGQVRSWLKWRDARDGQPDGARLAEHFERLRYVEKSFWWHGSEILLNKRIGATTRRWQVEFDDRGVVWMRFGRPASQIVPSAMADAALWTYRLSGQVFMLLFEPVLNSGTMSPTKLTRGFIALATESDDNSIRAEHNVVMGAKFYRLWDPVTERPMAVISYGALLKELKRNGVNNQSITVDLKLQQWDPATDVRRDTALTHTLRLDKAAISEGRLSGYIVAPTTLSTSVWSLAISQGLDVWGHAYESGKRAISPGPFRMSDLILGTGKQTLAWGKDGETITISPSSLFTRKDEVSLFLQTFAEKEYPDVTVTIAIYRGPVPDNSRPTLRFDMPLKVLRGLTSYSRILDVSRLAPGEYRLEVLMTSKSGTLVAEQSTPLRIR